MFQFLWEVDSTIWDLQLFHGDYLECNFYTNSLEFGKQLLHQNFGFLKLELIYESHNIRFKISYVNFFYKFPNFV